MSDEVPLEGLTSVTAGNGVTIMSGPYNLQIDLSEVTSSWMQTFDKVILIRGEKKVTISPEEFFKAMGAIHEKG